MKLSIRGVELDGEDVVLDVGMPGSTFAAVSIAPWIIDELIEKAAEAKALAAAREKRQVEEKKQQEKNTIMAQRRAEAEKLNEQWMQARIAGLAKLRAEGGVDRDDHVVLIQGVKATWATSKMACGWWHPEWEYDIHALGRQRMTGLEYFVQNPFLIHTGNLKQLPTSLWPDALWVKTKVWHLIRNGKRVCGGKIANVRETSSGQPSTDLCDTCEWRAFKQARGHR